jgi:hypothetical protein
VPGRPLASISNSGSRTPRRTELSQTRRTDSYPSRLGAAARESLTGMSDSILARCARDSPAIRAPITPPERGARTYGHPSTRVQSIAGRPVAPFESARRVSLPRRRCLHRWQTNARRFTPQGRQDGMRLAADRQVLARRSNARSHPAHERCPGSTWGPSPSVNSLGMATRQLTIEMPRAIPA